MLEIDALSLAYGRHEALHDVTLRVGAGETVAMLGANGAGKTSLLRAIAGLSAPQAGSIRLGGTELIGRPSHQIVELGVALVPEGRRLFGPMTVIENLLLGAYPRRARRSEATTLARIFELFPRLAERRHQAVRTMSGGEQQMVAIGRALMSDPILLLLDEPSLGLSPLLSRDLFAVLGRIAGQGSVGILLVEQNARRALSITRRAYLLSLGRVVGEGASDALGRDGALTRSYLGL